MFCLSRIVLMLCVFTAITVAEPIDRAEQIRRDAHRLQSTIAGQGGWEASSTKLTDWRQALQQLLDDRPTPARGKSFIANDAPLTGDDGRLMSARRAEQLIHEVQIPSPDEQGNRRYEQFYQTALAFHRQLAAEGVDLIIVPVPDKSDIHADELAPLPKGITTVQLQSKQLFLRLMRAGVEVVDLEPLLLAQRGKHDAPLYMKRDTHWSPCAIDLASAALAERLKRYDFVASEINDPPRFKVEPNMTINRGQGDLGENWIAAGNQAFPIEQYRYRGIRWPNGKAVGTTRDSPVLMLGDSFAVYPYNNHQNVGPFLSHAINLPIDWQDRAGGASAMVQQFSRLPDKRRKQLRVLIWLFNSCSLYEQGFRPPKVNLAAAADAAASDQLAATVTLLDSPPTINPAEVPYADALVTLRAQVRNITEGRYGADRILLTLPLMIDRKLTDVAQLKAGQTLTVELDRQVPRAQTTWMMFDETDTFDLTPYYVQRWRIAEPASGNP